MRKNMMVLEDGMQYTHEYDIVEETLTVFSPWNGAPLTTIHRITEGNANWVMRRLNEGAMHIYSEWKWHGSHGVHVAVVK